MQQCENSAADTAVEMPRQPTDQAPVETESFVLVSLFRGRSFLVVQVVNQLT